MLDRIYKVVRFFPPATSAPSLSPQKVSNKKKAAALPPPPQPQPTSPESVSLDDFPLGFDTGGMMYFHPTQSSWFRFPCE